jgi:hypothetical protein
MEAIEKADTLFEPITKITNKRVREIYDSVQSTIPYKLRRQKVSLVLCAEFAHLAWDLEELNTALNNDGHIIEGVNGVKQHPALTAKGTIVAKLSDIAGKLRINPPKDSRAAQTAADIEEQARDLKTSLNKAGAGKNSILVN